MPRLHARAAGQRPHRGTTAGKIAPRSAFADNDYALGMIVEAVSKSKFWASTAIFVLEDDAQNGRTMSTPIARRDAGPLALHAQGDHRQQHV